MKSFQVLEVDGGDARRRYSTPQPVVAEHSATTPASYANHVYCAAVRNAVQVASR
jgi:hypothetical protein